MLLLMVVSGALHGVLARPLGCSGWTRQHLRVISSGCWAASDFFHVSGELEAGGFECNGNDINRAPLAGLVSNVLDPDKPRRVHGQPEFRRYIWLEKVLQEVQALVCGAISC